MPAPLTLIVLNPDGTPAVDAVAVARVAEIRTDGTYSVPIYTSSPDGSGVLKVAVPLSDPYIKAHPEKRTFAIDVDLFTFHGVAGGPVKAYHNVNYILNLGDPQFSADPARVNNSVVQLERAPLDVFGTEDDPVQEFDNCDPPPNPPACMRVSHPADVQAERVVIAHNIGAGLDMKTQFSILGTARSGTSTVNGVDGFFIESKGHRAMSTYTSDQWGFESAGVSSTNEDAAILVNFAKVETRLCWATGCSYTTDYEPDDVIGRSPLLPTDEPIYHDYARNPNVGNTDCTMYVQNYYTNSNGVQKAESWTFGFDFQGQAKVFTLHATAVTTANQSEQVVTAYKWSVTGTQRPYHHVFVPYGHVSTGADAGSTCPYNSPGSTWTDADWILKENPKRPEHVKAPEQAPEPVKRETEEAQEEGGQQARRCEAAPERCGRDWRFR